MFGLKVERHGQFGPARAEEGRLTREIIMKAMNLIAKLVRDEQGGEVLEYALIAGLIVVAAIAVIGSVGTKVLARWGSLNSSM
jgi:Flp pilus assembly pilin Flp